MTTDTREALAALVAAHDALQARSWPGGPAQYEQQRDELRAAWANARAALATQPAQPVAKMAPVQGWPAGIPWSLHLEAYAEYCKRHGAQPALIDLEGRNCRGGFGVRELDSLIPGWRDRCGEIADLKAEVARLNALLAAAPRPAQPRPCGDCRKADSWGIPLSRTCQYDCKYEPLNKPSSKERAETLLQVSALGRAAHLVSNERGDDLHTPANDTAAQPSAQGESVAWLVEWKAHGHGPQWWGFNHTPGKNGTWCSDANNAIRFARKEDAERMRLHIIAVAGLTGMHDYERSVSVTEHMWEGPRRAE